MKSLGHLTQASVQSRMSIQGKKLSEQLYYLSTDESLGGKLVPSGGI